MIYLSKTGQYITVRPHLHTNHAIWNIALWDADNNEWRVERHYGSFQDKIACQNTLRESAIQNGWQTVGCGCCGYRSDIGYKCRKYKCALNGAGRHGKPLGLILACDECLTSQSAIGF